MFVVLLVGLDAPCNETPGHRLTPNSRADTARHDNSEGYRVHMERTGRSNGLMMGYFGNAEAPDAPFSFYYCDHLYADTWNKTEPGGACLHFC